MKRFLMTVLLLPFMTGAALADNDKFMDFTIPDFTPEPSGSTIEEKRENYRAPLRDFCTDSPYRPGWSRVFEPGEKWLSRVARGLYNIRRAELIKEANECTCTEYFPPWEDIRAELEQIAADNREPRVLYGEIMDKRLDLADDYLAQGRSAMKDVDRLCIPGRGALK